MRNFLCLLTIAIFGLLFSPADTFAVDDQNQTEINLTDEMPQIVCTDALTTDAISTETICTESQAFAERTWSKPSPNNKKFKRKTNRSQNRSNWLFPGNSDSRIRTCGAYN